MTTLTAQDLKAVHRGGPFPLGLIVARSADYKHRRTGEAILPTGRLYRVVVDWPPFIGVEDVKTGELMGVTGTLDNPHGNYLASGFRRPNTDELRALGYDLDGNDATVPVEWRQAIEVRTGDYLAAAGIEVEVVEAEHKPRTVWLVVEGNTPYGRHRATFKPKRDDFLAVVKR